jgi:alginate O-acetyltransferase complex protein AlgI
MPLTGKLLNKPFPLLKIFNQVKVFILVTIAWVFFRAHTMNEAMHMIRLMFSCDFSLDPVQLFAGKGPFNFLLSFVVVGFLIAAYFLPKNMQFKTIGRNVAFLSVFILLLFVLSQDAQGEFIYFQF